MKIYVGCSGWNYKDWKGKFYPGNLPQKEWLSHYMEHFNTVEVNNTFYRLPEEKTLKSWKDTAPQKFRFSLKGSRYVTQMKKLHEVEESVGKFEQLARSMKSYLSCILWQLPPNLHRDDEKLEYFCKLLKKPYTHVIEFRHKSWFTTEVYDILKKYKVVFCNLSSPDFAEDIVLTHKIGYLRLHGKGKKKYDYTYSKKELSDWYEKIQKSNAEEFYIYFNNDMNAQAPVNAKQLIDLFKK